VVAVVFEYIYLDYPSLNQSSNSGARADTNRSMFGRYLEEFDCLSLTKIDSCRVFATELGL